MSKENPIFETISDAEIRDAVMLYIVRILDRENGLHSLTSEELAHLTRVVHSETFLVALKCIKIENGIEDFQFYSLNILQGVKKPAGEDLDTLGDKLVEWVNETLEEYRKPLD